MPNSLQSSTIASPASRRAPNCSLSSITEHSFQGITPSPLRGESVTHVSATMCYLCLRPLTILNAAFSDPLHSFRLSALVDSPNSELNDWRAACPYENISCKQKPNPSRCHAGLSLDQVCPRRLVGEDMFPNHPSRMSSKPWTNEVRATNFEYPRRPPILG